MAEHRRTSAGKAGSLRKDFGDYRFDRDTRQLWHGDEEIKLTPRAAALLDALAERPMQVVTKQELVNRMWKGKAVGDDALTSCVQELRRALGDDSHKPKFVETRHRRGYRLLVALVPAAAASPAVENALSSWLSDKPSIAVLPFRNLSGDAEQDFFADGIAEDILAALSRFPSLFVIARKSSFLYKEKKVDGATIGRDLGVRYLLEGSVRKAGGRIRIAAQLLQADSGLQIWADRYDGDLHEVFSLQDRITEAVAGAIAPTIQRAEIERAQRRPPGDRDAYELYHRALSLYERMTDEANDAARALLERAIVLDPHYAAPLTLLNLILDCRVTQGWSTAAEISADSRRYMRLALQIDKHDPDVLALQARSAAYLDGRHEDAISLIQRSLAANPNSVMARLLAGWIYVYAGQPEAAVIHLEIAMRLNPRDQADFQGWIALSHALLQLRRDGEALEAARQAAQRAPNYVASWRVLAAILGLTDRLDEAHSAMATVLRLAPNMSLSRMKSMPTWSEAARARYFEGLRRAGMPD